LFNVTEAYCVSGTKNNRLMLNRKTNSVYSEKRANTINIACGRYSEFCNTEAGDMDSNHCVLKSLNLTSKTERTYLYADIF
jgi:predicted lactoylglutathione lyase